VLPGKTYKPEDLLRIAWRRKWLIVVPFVVATICTVVVSHRLPKRYRSETVILVIPQGVPDSYVRSTVTSHIEDRLTSLRQQILSRPRLEGIIQEFDLYHDLRKRKVMDDVVEQMRVDVDVKVERGDAFRISYISDSPSAAQQVTERLASLFINENLRDREVQADGTNQFLDSQLEEARQRLLEHEKKVEAYQKTYAGQLPNQVQGNLQAIQSTQMQLQALSESINRDQDRKLLLERQISELQTPVPDAVAAPPGTDLAPTATAAQQLEAAQARLRVMELHFKPEHPDVKAAKALIRDLEAKAQAEAAAISASPAAAAPRPVSAAELARQTRLRDLKDDLKNLDAQLAAKRQNEKQLNATISAYQAKIDAVPTREAELTELTRDYSTLQNAYTSLLAKRQDSKIAANLERNQRGEQFRVLDPARVPEKPASPDLMKIDIAGAALGLFIGLGIVALLEYLDSTFKKEEEIRQVLQLPVLALVPMMESEREHRAHRRRLKLVSLAAAMVVISGAVAVVLWKLQVG
jgi:protein tyrosine kinase modulator